MQTLSVAEMIPILQTSIGPTILLSGVGLLLVTMTNRLGRIIDRTQYLGGELREADDKNRARLKRHLAIMWKRARLIRTAIAFAAVSDLCAALLIIALFSMAIAQVELTWLIAVIFITCMLCLIGALLVFIWDINWSITASKNEIEDRDEN